MRKRRIVPASRSRKDIIIAVASDVLLAALCIVLIWLLRNDPNGKDADGKTRADAQSNQSYTEIKRQAAGIYGDFEKEMQQVMPGVICWGDIAATGNNYGTLTGKLYRLMARSLFSELARAFSFEARFYNHDLKIPVVNMGAHEEGMREILARCGANEIALGDEVTIPIFYGFMVNVRLVDGEGKDLLFATQRYAKFDGVTIDGIPGYLYVGTGNYDKTHPHLTFARENYGVQQTVPAGTPVETETAVAYRRYVPVLYFESTLGEEDEAFVQALERMLQRHENPGGCCAVIVHAQENSSLDQALKQAFSERYIRVGKTVDELRDEDYIRLADEAFACLDQQGAFDGVRQTVQATLARLADLTAQ